MPIITTFVIGARPGRPRRADAVGQQRAVRVPQLADDLGGREVAIEALLAGRAEGAVERAARLRRDAQACRGRPRECRPSRRHCRRRRRAATCGCRRTPWCRSPPPGRESRPAPRASPAMGATKSVIDATSSQQPLMHPVRHLLRAKRLLAQIGERAARPSGVEIEQVDHGRTQRSKTASVGKK